MPDEAGEPDLVVPEPAAPIVIRRRGRRVTTDPAPGSTGEPGPASLETTKPSTENDRRLRQDVPPHWG